MTAPNILFRELLATTIHFLRQEAASTPFIRLDSSLVEQWTTRPPSPQNAQPLPAKKIEQPHKPIPAKPPSPQPSPVLVEQKPQIQTIEKAPPKQPVPVSAPLQPPKELPPALQKRERDSITLHDAPTWSPLDLSKMKKLVEQHLPYIKLIESIPQKSEVVLRPDHSKTVCLIATPQSAEELTFLNNAAKAIETLGYAVQIVGNQNSMNPQIHIMFPLPNLSLYVDNATQKALLWKQLKATLRPAQP